MITLTARRYGPPEVLEVVVADRPVPGPGEVLVRVEASSLNMADGDNLRGYPLVLRAWTGWRRPRRRPGVDVSGRVVEVGADVTALRPGDEVLADLFGHGQGALAEYVCAPAEAFSAKPPAIDHETAATLPHSGLLAWQMLFARGPISPGDRVLVNGAGGCVGPFAIQIAKARGAEVTAVDTTTKLDLLRRLGADHVVDFTTDDYTRGDGGFELIVDVVGNRSIFRNRRVLRRGGRYTLVARNLSGFFGAAVAGMLVTATGRARMGVFGWEPNRRKELAALGELVVSGRIVPAIDSRIGLEEVPAALRRMQLGEAQGKVVVVP